MIEPVAWMVVDKDGQDRFVTADPSIAAEGQTALPLYVLSLKDRLTLEKYAEDTADALEFFDRELKARLAALSKGG